MSEHIGDAMPARIEMKFMGNLERIEGLVEFTGAPVEAKGVFGAAIKIDLRLRQRGAVFFRKYKWAIQVPEFLIDRVSEDTGQQLCRQVSGRSSRIRALRRGPRQCSAVRADRAEQFGMRERNAQRSVASHGKAGDPPGTTVGPNPVRAFDEGHEFAKEEIAVKGLAIPRVDVERVRSVRSYDQKIAYLAVAAQVLQRGPFSIHSRRLFISTKTVQQVQDRIPSSFCI